MTISVDRARVLLGANLNGHAPLSGHDLVAGHANRNGMTLLTQQPRRGWSWFQRDQRRAGQRQRRPGMRLIGTGAVLLVLLGAGLLAVSYAAQYRYVLDQRHQGVASLIEAGALDVGLIIFSLLALGLAMAGLASKTERAAIILCALASSVMNYAAADVTSPRSVLAYCMPPVFLAFVVDRVVSTVRRHVLGIREVRSPWAAFADAAARILRLLGFTTLYVLRFLVATPSTCAGLRRAILAAAPLPAAAESTKPDRERPEKPDRKKPDRHQDRTGTKTAQFLALVKQRHGELAQIPLTEVSKIATAIAPEAELHPASARTALLSAVRAALPPGKGDGK